MSTVQAACTPVPPVVPSGGGGGTQPAVMSKKLWEIGETVQYKFLSGTDNQKNAVTDTIKTWMQFANINLEVTTGNTPVIRITFDTSKGSWSYVGIDAKSITDQTVTTLNLGWLADQYPPTDDDKGTILHEFGHAIGMMHEHQSPARGERIHLKELAVYNYYRPLLGNDNSKVKSQVIDTYNLNDVSNYSHLDLQSIMMYFMPGYLNEEGIDVPVNRVLSDLDKAFITLSYPRFDAKVPSGGWTVKQALLVANVPDDIAGKILALMDPSDDTTLQKVREAFQNYNLQHMALVGANRALMNSIDATSGGQYGIRDTISKILTNPLFKGIVKNVVKGVFDVRKVPTVEGVPGSAQNDVLDSVGAVVTNPTFAGTISDLNTYFSGIAPDAPKAST